MICTDVHHSMVITLFLNFLAHTGGARLAPTSAHPRDLSPCGALGLAGNIFEWCDDAAPTGRHVGSAPGVERVNAGLSHNRRGEPWGAWRTESDPPDLRMTDVGFRCAFSPAPEAMLVGDRAEF